jgi:hypothetical protein
MLASGLLHLGFWRGVGEGLKIRFDVDEVRHWNFAV